MKLELGSSDILKGVLLVVVTVIVMFYYNSFTNRTNSTDVIRLTTKLSENAILIENIKADNVKVNKLLAEIRSKSKEQAKFIDKVNTINKNKGSKIEEIGAIVAKSGRTVTRHSNKSAITRAPRKTGDSNEDARRSKLEYAFTKIYSKDSNGNDLLLAWAMYFPKQDDPSKLWRTGTYPIEFNATIIESENVNGTFDRAVEVHIANNNQKETKDKDFPISIADVQWEKVSINSKSMMWWNPRFGLGANITNSFLSPRVDFSLSSYGRTVVDMDWRFMSLGVGAYKDGASTEPVIVFEPVSWNIGKALPIIENVFIGPCITYNPKSNINYGIGLSVPF